MKYMPSGTPVIAFSIATSEKWTGRDGQPQERTEWHDVEAWDKIAKALEPYLKKGQQVYVEGKLQTDEYTDRDGVKRRRTKVRADRIVLLGQAPRREREPGEDDDTGYGDE